MYFADGEDPELVAAEREEGFAGDGHDQMLLPALDVPTQDIWDIYCAFRSSPPPPPLREKSK